MRMFAYDLLSRNHLPQVWRQLALKAGRNASGIQRYRCQNPSCPTKTFMMTTRYRAYQAGIKEQAVEMVINGSGIRDTARVLKIDKNTIISTLKKAKRWCRSTQSCLS